jgi:predicted nucleic acid-binding protein
MGPIVSNTSPIINLAALHQLQLLQQLYGRIVIPTAVYHEIVVQGAGQPGAIEVQTEAWLEQRAVTNQILVTGLLTRNPLLNRAEAEAIALAVELNAGLLLIDEAQGRTTADTMGIPIRGLLGVLAEAKRQGLVPLVKPLMDDLIHQAGFFIAQALYEQIIHDVGE